MQISPAPSSLLSALASSAQGKTAEGAEGARVAAPGATPSAATALVADGGQDSVTVTLSGQLPPPPARPAVYAELWLGGNKVGEVYVDGQANVPGLPAMATANTTASAAGNAGGGIALARQRADEIARMTGAELRYADPVDLQTERTRAALRNTYRDF